MTNQIPENWLEQVDEEILTDAVIQETQAMVASLGVYFNIEKPGKDSVIIALMEGWGKPSEEIFEILNAFIRFKAKISLLDCFYGELFHHDEDDSLVLTPDVLEMVYGGSDDEELELIKKAQKELAEAGLYIDRLDIRFQYLS
jgi:hypothetical protein